MKRILAVAVVLASSAALARAQQPAQQGVPQATAPAASHQIDLAPTGKMLTSDKPVLRGNTYVFHSYPAGTLMSLRRSQIKTITPITIDVTDPSYKAVQIGNLAMAGGSTQAGAKNANTVKSKAAGGQQLGEGFYSDLKMGESLADDAGRSGDYQVGRTYAYAPATASQSSPGAPPTAPGSTNGQNPPTMSGAQSGTNPQ
jgi:hypothetical protein